MNHQEQRKALLLSPRNHALFSRRREVAAAEEEEGGLERESSIPVAVVCVPKVCLGEVSSFILGDSDDESAVVRRQKKVAKGGLYQTVSRSISNYHTLK